MIIIITVVVAEQCVLQIHTHPHTGAGQIGSDRFQFTKV